MHTLVLLLSLLQDPPAWATEAKPLDGEKRFEWVRRLTTNVPNGTHAEAYFSPDGRKLILQAIRDGDKADQIYALDLADGSITRLSSGKGKCTCAYFLKDGGFIYSSTHHKGDEPPPPPDRSKGYIWPLYRTFDVFRVDGDKVKQLTDNEGYDAEATVSPDGRRLVFTSHRDGGIGLWTMNVDGTGLAQVKHRRGYAGGAFFSPDNQWLVYRAFYPSNETEEAAWKRMLDEAALVPVPMEVYLARPDGSEERAVTKTGKVNFAPIFHPDGKRILFTSDVDAKHRGQYALWLIGADGTNLERVTFHEGTAENGGFDGFPCFSPDGKTLAWISNRGGSTRRDLNVYLARWKE